MSSEYLKEAEVRMTKSVESLRNDLHKIRTGRAHPSLVEHLKVSYYGSDTPLSQVANVTVSDARTLTITPWDKTMIQAIEKAIHGSDMGLNPVTAGTVIRVPLPALTEERRRDLGKLVRTEAENAKVAVRNIRRDVIQVYKDLQKDKEITEDDLKKAEENVQKLTDKYVAQIDQHSAAKEKELLEI
jgi:ribosome recycling factor